MIAKQACRTPTKCEANFLEELRRTQLTGCTAMRTRIFLISLFIVSCATFAHPKPSPPGNNNNHNETNNMSSVVQQTVQCTCGKVKLQVNSPSVLRLVCYCKDCRGYYKTLNKEAEAHHHKPAAMLDPFGGVDWTCMYPNEITVLQGKEHLKTCLIRPKSPIRRVYTTCCYTPMFNIGSSSALLNTNLILLDKEDKANLPDVRFRIIGRQALPASKDASLKKPPMSWSVPLSFPFVMIKRIKKEKMEPLPLDMDNVSVLENFQEG